MICFRRDWNRYPNAIADTKTKNKYILEYCTKLKESGTKHWYFALALHNPRLQGVDPYSEDLTQNEKLMIALEIKSNPWYFIREIIRDKNGGPTAVEKMFRAHRGNIATMWCFLNCLDIFSMAPRQTGKSFMADCIALWCMYFGYSDNSVNIFTKDSKLATSNIKRLKKLRENWPSWLNPHMQTDDDNQQSLSCNSLDNKLMTHVYRADKEASNGMGRGLTSPTNIIDEPAFGHNIGIALSAIVGATGGARKNAIANGLPFATIYTTTAGDLTTASGETMHKIWEDGCVWNERYLDCEDREEFMMYVSAECGNPLAPLMNITMSHTQLGYSNEWLMAAYAKATLDGKSDNAERDYLNIWTFSSDGSIWTVAQAKDLTDSGQEPIDMQLVTPINSVIRWYEDIKTKEHVFLGVDTSNATGSDDLANVWVDVSSGKTIGVCAVNNTSTHGYMAWLGKHLIQNPNVTLIIENKMNAIPIIDSVVATLRAAGIDPYTRMFSYVIQDPEDNAKANAHLRNKGGMDSSIDYVRKKIGFSTNAARRDQLFDVVLKSVVRDQLVGIRDRTIITQLLGLEVRNNRVDHKAGSHDDLAIAFLFCHWLLKFGKNLTHYGVKPNTVLSELSKVDESAMTIDERVELAMNAKIESKIRSLKASLEEDLTRSARAKIELLLEQQISMHKGDDESFSSLDDILASASTAANDRNEKKGSASRFLEHIAA